MGHKISFQNIHNQMLSDIHGKHEKDMAVLHETVSPDVLGWKDIYSVEVYLDRLDYGIHGLTDLEGHKAWAYGLGEAVFWQAGGVNERSIGIEQVSNIPTLVQNGHFTMEQAAASWAGRSHQLHATAMLLACWHNVDPEKHVLKYSDATKPGVTTHWDVSQHFSASLGHTDCHPVHKGGYYPVLEVIEFAKQYVSLGYHF
jgi:hypothetical protein